MVHKDSTIKWAVSMNKKVEKEAQKSYYHMIGYTVYFGIRETH